MNGQVIRTTGEHPFYVIGKGWTDAISLQEGDLLCSLDGSTVAVEKCFDTDDYETVYNCRIADYHTYFVGDEGWGWSVWAHNADCVVAKVKGTQTWTILDKAGNVLPAAAGKKFGNPANAAKFAYDAGVHTVTINKQLIWSAEKGLSAPPVKLAGAEVKIGSGHIDHIITPTGLVEVRIYAGGYNVGSKQLGLDRHHQAGAAVVAGGNATIAVHGQWPGVTVYDFPSKGVLIWNNKSGALPTALTNGERRVIQRGLESHFPGRKVIFDKDTSALSQYRAELVNGGAK